MEKKMEKELNIIDIQLFIMENIKMGKEMEKEKNMIMIN